MPVLGSTLSVMGDISFLVCSLAAVVLMCIGAYIALTVVKPWVKGQEALDEARKEKQARGARTVAICYAVAGLLFCLAGVIGGNVAVNLSLGAMSVCLSTVFVRRSRKAPPRQDAMQGADKTGPGDGAGPNVFV